MGKKFKVTKAAERPGGNFGKCFYCRSAIGDFHKDDCGLVKKKVKVRAVIEYEVSVPHEWDKHMIEFNRNESSWYVGNIIGELEDLEERVSLSRCIKFEYLNDVTGPYLDE